MDPYERFVGEETGRGLWRWNSDRALLYAVGVGAGLDDPLSELQFTTENSPGVAQQVIPTFVTLMGLRTDWMERFGWVKEGLSPVGMVHGEQSVTLMRPLPVEGEVQLVTKVGGVYDKGSGVLVLKDTRITMADTGELLALTRMSLFVQGKGGYGGPRGPEHPILWSKPERAPDVVISLPVGLNQSLIYRLSGDRHPHGTDPGRARADGFPRPIYYGLGTYGVACRALLRGVCDSDVARFGHMDARFSKPVHPGDRLDMQIWRTDDGALFQMLAYGERVVLDRGVFRFAGAG